MAEDSKTLRPKLVPTRIFANLEEAMSTDYISKPAIKFSSIEHADFTAAGFHIMITPSREAIDGKQCCLTDGQNYLWAYSVDGKEPGDLYNRAAFAKYGSNDVMGIINALEEHFGVEMISEHEDDYVEDNG